MSAISSVVAEKENVMRNTIVVALSAFMVGGVATGAVLSHAQSAQSPQAIEQVQDSAGAMHAGMPHPGMQPGARPGGMMGWMHRPQRPFNPRAFSLVYPQKDRQLSAADVQKIAESFLLWNGNHSWKISDVAPTSGGPIGFSVTTPEGSVIAKFTMDPHSGRIARIG
jgi:hypothetical protein